MIVKTVFMLSIYLIPIILINVGWINNVWLLFGMYMLAGLGAAGVGMGIMHDANHGSYSRNKHVNKYLGYTMNLVGASASVWKIQHNVLHHTYTNIKGADDDINPPNILRFSPSSKRFWMHRYQHLYVWFFYAISTLSWVISTDYVRALRYHKLGFFNKKNELKREILKIFLWKGFYFSFTLILPILTIPLAPWIIILAFISMHFVTGLSLSIVFQAAHVMPGNDFPVPDDNGLIQNDWSVHQLATTSNFSPRNKFLYWLIGGLNYQIEHHLFPNISHVHYKKISPIVANTAREFGLPYHTKKTFISAIWDHVGMLKQLGKMELNPVRR
jgi:linoleoyl-CoA desaturase